MQQEKTYWFPAKNYGWGWGVPRVWQGWAVLGIFTALMVAGGVFVLPVYGPAAFSAYSAVLAVLLTAVCWFKGEPPSWRWGKK